MTTDLSSAPPGNARKQPRRPANPCEVPVAAVSGRVRFGMVAKDGQLTFTFEDLDGKDLVGSLPGQGPYLRVPEGTIVEIELLLSDAWEWSFASDDQDFTLARPGHENRFWIKPGVSDKRKRVIVIEPSGAAPETDAASRRNDEKFNLGVSLAQSGNAGSVGIEIDPIVKNPPPVGG